MAKTKVKVFEVDATKLDPNAKYLIVANREMVKLEDFGYLLSDLRRAGIKITGFDCLGPPDQAVKIYSIPEEDAGE